MLINKYINNKIYKKLYKIILLNNQGEILIDHILRKKIVLLIVLNVKKHLSKFNFTRNLMHQILNSDKVIYKILIYLNKKEKVNLVYLHLHHLALWILIIISSKIMR